MLKIEPQVTPPNYTHKVNFNELIDMKERLIHPLNISILEILLIACEINIFLHVPPPLAISNIFNFPLFEHPLTPTC